MPSQRKPASSRPSLCFLLRIRILRTPATRTLARLTRATAFGASAVTSRLARRALDLVQLRIGRRSSGSRHVGVLGAVAAAAFAGFARAGAGFAAAGTSGLVGVWDGVDVHAGHCCDNSVGALELESIRRSERRGRRWKRKRKRKRKGGLLREVGTYLLRDMVRMYIL